MRVAVWLRLFAGGRAGTDGGQRGRGGRLCEATKIVTMEDKILMAEALNNTGWTSAYAERISLLWNRPAMCGSAFTGAYRHHHLDHLVHLVVSLEAGGERRAQQHGDASDGDRRFLMPSICRPIHLLQASWAVYYVVLLARAQGRR